MDSNIENIDLLRSYILKLTDNDIYELEEISLTSAQKSRIASWCEANGIEIPNLNNKNFWKNPIKSDLRKNTTMKPFSSNISNAPIVGIDIQKISEFFPEKTQFTKNDESLLSIFTKKELSYAESKLAPRETLVGIFAAKESIFKCSNIINKNWSEIEINYKNKKPEHKDFNLSISHSGDYVIAIAITEPISITESDHNQSIQNEKVEKNLKLDLQAKITKCFNIVSYIGGIFFMIYLLFLLIY